MTGELDPAASPARWLTMTEAQGQESRGWIEADPPVGVPAHWLKLFRRWEAEAQAQRERAEKADAALDRWKKADSAAQRHKLSANECSAEEAALGAATSQVRRLVAAIRQHPDYVEGE